MDSHNLIVVAFPDVQASHVHSVGLHLGDNHIIRVRTPVFPTESRFHVLELPP